MIYGNVQQKCRIERAPKDVKVGVKIRKGTVLASEYVVGSMPRFDNRIN